MQRVTGEVRLWRREAIVELLRDGLAIVDEIDPPSALREETYRTACNLLAQKNVELEQVGMAVPNMAIPRG